MNGHLSLASGQDGSTLEYQLAKLKVPELKEVLKQLGLKRSGKKSELVDRCRSYVQSNPHQLATVQALVHSNFAQTRRPPAAAASATAAATSFPGGGGGGPTMGWRLPGWSAGGQFRAGAASVGVPPRFVSSPFFDNIVELTTPERLDSTTCFGAMQKVMIVQVSSATVAALGRNPKLRIYLRCGKFDGAGALVSSFPRMIRWYLDGQHITEAAQTRFCPIDITGHMQVGGRVGARTYRLEVYQANRMDPVPNSTLRKYAAQVMIAEAVPVQQLVDKLRLAVVPEAVAFERVLAEVRQADAEKDDDVVLQKVVVSLNCPLSQMRIALPCRGVHCAHLQCVDATFYLTVNSRRETWLCPVCNKQTPLESLRVDGWMVGVLAKAPPEVADVQLNEDGSWVAVASDEVSASAARDEARKRRRIGSAKRTSSGNFAGAGPAAAGGGLGGGAAAAANTEPGLSASTILSLLPTFGDAADGVHTGALLQPGVASAPSVPPVLGSDLFRDLEQYLGAGGGGAAAAPSPAVADTPAGLREDEPICIWDSD